MPAVAKKIVKVAKKSKPQKVENEQQQQQQQNDVETVKPKKQSLKKIQKTAEIVAAKKLAKLKSKKAVSDKLNRAPAVKKQKAKHQYDATRLNRGVMLIQNLPKGFYEKELKKYFTQYGRVTRLRLARSESTGGSKGHAYIEFKHPEVAQVACESMDGYLMFRQRLKTVYIPPAEQDHDYFKQPVKFVKTKAGETKLITPKTVRVAHAVKMYNKRVTPEVQADRVERSKYKLKFLQKKLAKAGINIDLSEQLYTSATPADENANEKGNDTDNDTTLNRLLNNTINSDESDDDDYEPTPEEMKKIMAEGKKIAQKSKLTESSESKPKAKGKKSPIEKKPLSNEKQKKRKADTKVMPTQQPQDVQPKKKKVKAVKDVVVNTPKAQKIRKNYVTAPTPEAAPKKQKNKKNLNTENVAEIPVKPKKSKKTAISNDTAADVKKVAASKVAKSKIKQIKSAPIQTKPSKKGINKKK